MRLDSLARRCDMRTAWALQDAKNRFSEVVENAMSKGPQLITRRGQDAVVVVSVSELSLIHI